MEHVEYQGHEVLVHLQLRGGAQVPLLVDLAQLYVFDHQGRRVCPAPVGAVGLD
ncbi:hypothetical protein GCM10010329_62550 [Streptomyces spiroverticillatus]|nr:hypothetical protein GCM10010329_62550 [Streptomyces spiroverticillatus]